MIIELVAKREEKTFYVARLVGRYYNFEFKLMSIVITGQNELPCCEYSGVFSQNKAVHVLLLPSVSFLGRVPVLVDVILCGL